ncbi:MAG: caspase family protein [Bacteroidia bacterium]|nr:caspase family protein [Bacteroidia bacterium]
MKKAALLFGIDNYKRKPLSVCSNNVFDLQKVLGRNGDVDNTLNFECLYFPSKWNQQLTKDFILEKTNQFFSKDLDFALVYFAGHGSRIEGKGYFVPWGASEIDKDHVAERKEAFISFEAITEIVNNSSIKRIVVILDCCYSGDFSDIGINMETGMRYSQIREGVSILLASDEWETSLALKENSLFTGLLLDGLNGEAANVLGEVSVSSLYSYVDQLLGSFDQQPEFKTNTEERIILRKVQPRASMDDLKRLPKIFKSLDHQFELDPTFEFSSVPPLPTPIDENVEVFQVLQRLVKGSLVIPTPPREHMYFAAIESGTCELTSLGKFYWKMARKNKI